MRPLLDGGISIGPWPLETGGQKYLNDQDDFEVVDGKKALKHGGTGRGRSSWMSRGDSAKRACEVYWC